MFSATYSLVQILSLLSPGFIFLLIVKKYFNITENLWKTLTQPGEIYGALIPLLFIALAFGIMLQAMTYIISRPALRSKLKKLSSPDEDKGKKGPLNIGRLIKELDGDQMNVVRGMLHFHETMLNMFIVLFFLILKLAFDPTHVAKDFLLGIDIRLLIIFSFCFATGLAAKMSLDSLVRVLDSINKYLGECPPKNSHSIILSSPSTTP